MKIKFQIQKTRDIRMSLVCERVGNTDRCEIQEDMENDELFYK